MAEQEKIDVPLSIPEKIKYHFIKSNYFRIIHVDGAYGGITTRGAIEINLYSERPAIPQVTVHQIKSDGTLGDEIKGERVSRDGFIREIEVGAIINIDTAIALRTWLNDKIDTLERLQKEAEEKEAKEKEQK